MILESSRLAVLRELAADVHVIGSGPVGIVTALALADRGFRVLVLESGGAGLEPAADDLAVAECLSPDSHFEPHTAVARRLGGTSNLWAGRCVPFDPIDFRARPWLGLKAWPITEDDLAPFLAPALAALGAGEAVFSAPIPGVAADAAFRCDTLERWTNRPRIQKLHGKALVGRPDLTVALRSTVTGFRYGPDGAIAGL
ncbi:NAD(P)-binding protein [Amaricoccus sp.]|uniref:NAD(P)-binding protein n=1 Tax=Amaricoccus sp. TaxID=1872485 RepID=UPI00261BDD58|nr:NAD(P)-binding protein [Amaricoccus sp.]HRO13018.1 NAD(P)-binding protein [Amaricoccus sp.]